MVSLKYVLGVALLVVAACSSGGGSGGGNDLGNGGGGSVDDFTGLTLKGAGSGTTITAAELNANLASIDALLANDELTALPAPEVDPTGEATLTGAIQLVGEDWDDGDASVIGNLTINADFDTGTATATADGFGEFAEAQDGSLLTVVDANITGGTLTTLKGEEGTLTATSIAGLGLDGTITTEEGNAIVDATLNGTIGEIDGDLVATGSVSGNFTIDGEPAEAIDAVESAFIADE